MNKTKILIINIIIVSLLVSGSYYAINNYFNKEEKATYLYDVINKENISNKYYFFKGNAKNNYLEYNNLLWRILKVNENGSISLVLNDYINIIPYSIGDDFNILEYLNDKFLKELDVSKLEKNNICMDTINNLNTITCSNISSEYVSMLDINNFIESIDDKSYISNEGEMIWLINEYDENYAWHTNGSKISYSKKEEFYEVKPLVTLKNNIIYEGGNGLKSNPYIIKNDNLTIGSTLKLGNNEFLVYETNPNIKVVKSSKSSKKYSYIGSYLDLIANVSKDRDKSIDDYIVRYEWVVNNIVDNKINKINIDAKYGTPNIFDLKVDNNKDYYLLGNSYNHVLVYDTPIIYGSRKGSHYLRLAVVLDDTIKDKIIKKDNIFIIE